MFSLNHWLPLFNTQLTSSSATPVGILRAIPLWTMLLRTVQNGLRRMFVTPTLTNASSASSPLRAMLLPVPILNLPSMALHYLRLSQLVNLGFHSRALQIGPLMLRKSSESVYVSSIFVKKLQRLSALTEFICKFAEVCVLPIILYC